MNECSAHADIPILRVRTVWQRQQYEKPREKESERGRERKKESETTTKERSSSAGKKKQAASKQITAAAFEREKASYVAKAISRLR